MPQKPRQTRFERIALDRRTTMSYLPRPVRSQDLNRLLECARWAPSSLNLQPWEFHVVTRKGQIREILRGCFHGRFFSSPPCIVAFCIPHRYVGGMHRGVREGRIGNTEALLSIAMPALTFVYAAQDAGLATGIITPDKAVLKHVLGLHGKDVCPIAVALGYPKKGGFIAKPNRHPLAKIVKVH